MGTKLDPGPYDCYAKLAPDEPYLTLRAKDPSAPYFVMMWVKVRQGDLNGALQILTTLAMDQEVQARMSADGKTYDKLEEALRIAFAMKEWRTARLPQTGQPAARTEGP